MRNKDEITVNAETKTSNSIRDPMIFEDICENGHDLIQCVDKEGKFVYVNKKWIRTLGYSREEIAKLKLNDILHPDHRRECSQLFKRVLRGETIEDIETVFLTSEGKEIIVHGNVKPRMKDGKFLTTVGIFSDITLRKMGEEALMKSEEQYRNIVELTPDGIATIDTKGVVTSCNTAFLNLMGFVRDEIVGKHFTKLPTLRIRDIPKYLKILGSILRDEVPKPFEITWLHKDGSEHMGEVMASVIRDKNRIVGIQTIARDMTERKNIELALKDSEERYRDLVEKAGIAIGINDSEGKFRYVNRHLADLFGYTLEEMKQNSMESLIHPDDRSSVMKTHKGRLEGKDAPQNYEFRGIKKDGSAIHVEISVALIKEGDRTVGTRAYMWDITGRKQTEDELRVLSLIDQLTGLYNRRGFLTLVKQQVQLAYRTKRAFLFCLLISMI